MPRLRSGVPTVMGPDSSAAIEAIATPNLSTSVLARLRLLFYLIAALSISAEAVEANSFTPVQDYVTAQELPESSTVVSTAARCPHCSGENH